MQLNQILEIIEQEPELPGEPPADMLESFHTIFKDRDIDALLELLRLTVKVTKESIIERITETNRFHKCKEKEKTFMDKKIFLGGTCNDSTWRDKLIPLLKIDYFNPVVDDWTHECQEEEIRQRETCDYVLYAITPKMTGVYAIAEVVDDSNKRPEKTILVIIPHDEEESFDIGQRRSLEMLCKMVENNGGKTFNSSYIEEIAEFINDVVK